MPDAPIPSADPPSSEINGLDPAELLARGLQTVRPTGDGRWVPPDAEEVARLLPQYQIECLLGRGGMGAVYKGMQLSLARPVAIKLLPVEMGADSQFVARFQREARTLARLHHSSIVAVYEFGQTEEGHLYFVMEYVDGTDLRQVLRGPGLQIEQALVLISQICDALHAAHRQGVMHRDIKPENVLLTSEGDVKLADFGLARPVHEEEDAGLTGTNVVMGTPAYMAPEQHEGRSDHRADIYALGVMLYEMLTGRPPRGGVVMPPSYRYQVDVRIDEVVMRAMQGEPELRYQSAVEMKSAVDRILTTSPLVGTETAPAPETQESHQALKQKGWGAGIEVALVLCLLAVAAGAWLRLRKTPEEKSPRPARIVTPTSASRAPETPPIAPARPRPLATPAAVASLSATSSPTPKLTSLTPPTPAVASATPAGNLRISEFSPSPAVVAPKLPLAASPLPSPHQPARVVQTIAPLDPEHLKGWTQTGPGGFKMVNGLATSWVPAGPRSSGICWYTQRQFADMEITTQFKTLEPTSNSGLMLRCAHPNGSFAATGDGYEVQIYGLAKADQPTGSIYNFHPPTSVPQRPGEWNELTVRVIGQKYTVHLNGWLVNEFVGNRSLVGYVGLQNHWAGAVQFRNLRISELAAPAPNSAPAPTEVALSPLQRSETFLRENEKKEGVKNLPSGLQYKVLREGAGRTPTAKNSVVVNYSGTLLTGAEFDSSYERYKPAEFSLLSVIPGWREGLQHMREGSKYMLYVPPSLAYGERGTDGAIGPNEALIFEIELLQVK